MPTDDGIFGLLGEARWISADEREVPPAGQRPAYLFRFEFTLGAEPSAAEIVATAHGVYEIFCNDMRVGDQELTPGLTSYRSTLQVQRFDVAGILRRGRNEIRVVLSDGWFRGRCGASRIPDNYGTTTSFITRLLATLVDGTTVSAATDESWSVGVGEIIAADLMDGQVVDFRRRDAVEWSSAVLSRDPLTRHSERLIGSEAPPVRRTRTYPALTTRRLASGRQIIDFGTMVNGWVRLRDLGPAGTETCLTHGEWLTADGDLNTDHVAYPRWPSAEILTTGQLDRVISRGDPRDVFEPRHTTHGFRYVAIDGRNDDIAPAVVDAVLVRSDMTSTATFATDDDDLNRLHDITVQSWLVNTCDVPTDCPQRERWGYTGDIQIFAHTAAFLEDIEGFALKWLRSLADDQAPSGLITNVAPMCGIDPIIPVSLDGAAGWGDAATMVPWEIYRAYGDDGVLRQSVGMMRRWVDYVAHRARNERHPTRAHRSAGRQPHEEFIWDTGWQWGEWAEPDVNHDPDADQGIVATAYFQRSAAILSTTLAVLGDSDAASHYADLADKVRRAWCTEFLEAGRGRLAVDRQSNYVRALAFELVPDEVRTRLAERLVVLIDDAEEHLTTGFLASGLLLPALAETGWMDVAYRLLRQRTPPSWMTMLDRGATAIWESWNGVDDQGRAHGSLAHYSKGAVISFLHEYVVGLRQEVGSVGWDRFVVAPRPDDRITSAHLEYRSRHGLIAVGWSASSTDIALTVQVPAGSSAEVRPIRGNSMRLGAGSHELSLPR